MKTIGAAKAFINKRLNRFTLRGGKRVGTQWRLYCLVHNIEKLAGCELKK